MTESQSWAIATQQAHKLGKTPKDYGTAEGKETALAKYQGPRSDYRKTADRIKKASLLVQMQKRANVTIGKITTDADAEQFLDRFSKLQKDVYTKGEIIAAKKGDEYVGGIVLKPGAGGRYQQKLYKKHGAKPSVTVSNFIVSPSERGKGIGGRLLAEATDGRGTVVLGTDNRGVYTDKAALYLYQQAGFKPVKKERRSTFWVKEAQEKIANAGAMMQATSAGTSLAPTSPQPGLRQAMAPPSPVQANVKPTPTPTLPTAVSGPGQMLKQGRARPEWLDKPRRGERLDPKSEDFAKNQALGRALGRAGLPAAMLGSVGGGLAGGLVGKGGVGRVLGGAVLGGLGSGAIATSATYPKRLREQMVELEKRRARHT